MVRNDFGQHMVGKFILHTNGAKAGKRERIAEAHDYEPADRSVGIWSGLLYATLTSGLEIYITDDGGVYDMNNDYIGYTRRLGVDY